MLLGLFALIELPFSLAWLNSTGGFWGTHHDFCHHIAHSPLYQVTAIDFGATAGLVFVWMLVDSHRHGYRWLPWACLPVFLYCPTLGLLGYLIVQRRQDSGETA